MGGTARRFPAFRTGTRTITETDFVHFITWAGFTEPLFFDSSDGSARLIPAALTCWRRRRTRHSDAGFRGDRNRFPRNGIGGPTPRARWRYFACRGADHRIQAYQEPRAGSRGQHRERHKSARRGGPRILAYPSHTQRRDEIDPVTERQRCPSATSHARARRRPTAGASPCPRPGRSRARIRRSPRRPGGTAGAAGGSAARRAG